MKRKLHDAPEKEKRRLFIPIFIASILIFSIFGIIFSSPSETQGSNTLTYEDWTFRRAQTGWTVTIDGFDVTTFYTPLDLLDITIPSTISTDLKTAEKIYLSRDPQSTAVSAERDIYLNFKPFINIFLACPQDAPGCEQLPLKSCADATDTTMIIALTLDEQQRMTYEDHCLTLSGDSSTVTQLADSVVFTFFNVL